MKRNLVSTVVALLFVVSGVPCAVSAEESVGVIEEIVVTARKRTESLQDVPISVAAVSGDVLESAAYQELNDIDRITPNVVFEGLDRTKPLINVRGIGTRTYDPGSDPSVGVFIDGVYLGRFGGLDMDLMQIERIEVLKGPQGTLYGRNTIGGALSVVTKDPTDEFESEISVEAGASDISGDDLWSISGRVAGPLGDSGVLGSLAVSKRERDGYIKVQQTGVRGGDEDSISTQGKLIFPLGETAELKIAADYTDMDGPALVFTRDDLDGRSPSLFFPAPPQPTDLYEPTGNETDVFTDKEIWGVAATLDWSVGEIEITSITSYRELDWEAGDDLDASELDVSYLTETEEADQFSQELRLNWSTDNADLLLGVFYGQEEVERVDSIDFGPDGLELLLLPLDLVWDFGAALDSTSFAVFAQYDWRFADDWTATIGGRYSEDEKDFDFDIQTLNILLPGFQTSLSEDWDSFDPSVSIKWDVSDDAMLYASWTSGYKSGSFQFFPTSELFARQVADPEEVESIEVGIKSQWLDQRLQINAAIFDMEYEDLQLLSLRPLLDEMGNDTGVSALVIDNAADSSIQGFEVELRAVLSAAWALDFSYGYLDAEFDDYVRGPTEDFSGNKLARSPEHSINVALNFGWEFSFGKVDGRIGYTWRDEYYFEPDNELIDPNSQQDAEGLLDASLKFGLQDGWSILIWGRNLTDERYRTSVLNSTGDPQRTGGIEPRTMGVRVTKRFGA